MTDQKDYTQEPGGGHLPDLHPYDYTRDERVLAACGWKFQPLRVFVDKGVSDVGPVSQGPYWFSDSGKRSDITPILTLSELWEGLCRAIPFNKQWAHILGQYAVVLYYGYPEERWFLVVDHGSLPNAVAAALYWVLQRGGESGEFFEE